MKMKFHKGILNKSSCFHWVYFTLLVIFISFNCCTQKGTQEPDSLQDMVCKPVDQNVELFSPLKITYIDERFFVPDFHGERMIHEIRTEPFEWIQDFAVRGKGPIEFIGPLLTWEFDSQLFVFDRQGFRLGVFDIMTPDHYSTYKYSELFYVESNVSQLISINNDAYLAAGFFEDGRYAVLDSLGSVKSYFGTYPAFMAGENTVPHVAKAMFHQAQFTANYGKGKIVALSSHVMDIIDISERSPDIISRIKLDDYAYDYQSGTILRTNLKNGHTSGARSITSGKEYIYVLNNPRIKGADVNNEIVNTEILIFEWNEIGRAHV